MSAAKRVAHAAETVRARWERGIAEDPQTEAAQALEDTCQLLDPEVAEELAAFRALELGDPDGRVSASCGKPNHLTWLRKFDDMRACPWCVMELQNDSLVARTRQLANYQRLEWEREAAGRADGSRAAVANLRIAELNQERDTPLARVAELELTVQQMCDALNGHDCPPPNESPMETVTRVAVRLMEAERQVAELEAWKAADEKVQPHRQAVANSNLHYIGKQELRIRRARVLHVNHPDPERCEHDGMAWPCPTVAALEAAVGEAVHPCGCPKRFGRHADGCPTEAARKNEAVTGDTFPAWLYQRFMPDGEGWGHLDSGQREYWEHHAAAVRRAVARNGFKPGGDDAALALGAADADRSADRLTRTFMSVQALREDDGYESPLHHDYLVGHDLPETGGAQ